MSVGDRVDENTGIDLRQVFGTLRRQLRLIVGVVVVVVAVAAFVVFSLKPVYTASSLILVDTASKNILDPAAVDSSSSTAGSRVDSEVELAKSPTVLLRVIRDANLLSDPNFAPQPSLLERTLSLLKMRPYEAPTGTDLLNATVDKLRDAISVQRRGLTFVIAIQAQSGDAQEAAHLANAVAQAYIADQLDAKVNSTLAARDIIQARIKDASQAVANSDATLDTFIDENFEAIAQETGRLDLQSLKEDINSASQARQQLLTTIGAADVGLGKRDWGTLTQVLQSEALKQFELRREQLSATLSGPPISPADAINLRAELANVESQLASAARTEIASLQSKVSDEQTQLSDLRTRLRSNVLSSNLSSATLTKIYGLQQTAEIARNQYQTLLTRLNDLGQQANLQVADSRIASEALPPDTPSFPNPRLFLSVALILALALGLGLAFIFEHYIGGVVSPEQLELLVSSPRVIAVPRQKEQRGFSSLADMLPRAPLSAFAEAIRKVRLAADQSLPKEQRTATDHGTVVLVTSSGPNEGKTTTALSLARAYAQSGKTTLLIDCDLRKPSVHRQLGWDPSAGLIDYLSSPGKDGLASIVRLDESSAIGVVVGSRRGGTVTDSLVAGPAFDRLIQAARNAYDVVVLDTPPVEPIVDASYLAQFADVIVFVVRWASTTQSEVRRAVSAISEAMRPGVQLTFALNQVEGGVGRNYAKYGYYYTEP